MAATRTPGTRRNLMAVILGGGAGSRLFPLTQRRSKPAVPLGGKYRLVDVPISNCINSNVTRIYVLTQYNSASLNRHISRTYRFSQFADGFVEIIAAEQTPENPQWFQGTADAVRQALPHLSDVGIDTLLILSGDHLYRMDYRKFFVRHYESKADVTVSVIPCERSTAEEFGLLKTDLSGRITEFREKPKGAALEEMRVDTRQFGLADEEAESRPFLASMGIYVFNFKRLQEFLTQNTSWVDFGREVIPAAIKSGNVQAFVFDDYWEDIGTISAFYRANLEMTVPLPKFNLFNAEAPIFTRGRHLPPSKVQYCEISNCIVTEGCIINGARMSNSIIGLRSRISPGAHIEDSILMGSDYYQTLDEMDTDTDAGQPSVGIGRNAVIRRAIIDKDARIGAGVQLINKDGLENYDSPDESFYIRDHIIIIPKSAVIKDDTVI